MITFGVCDWCLGTEGVAAIQRAGELGFEAIEIGVNNLEGYHRMCDPAIQKAYLEAAATHGIKLACIGLNVFSQVVTLHDKAQESTVREILSKMIDVAAAMKIEQITCAMFAEFGISNTEEMAQTSAMLRHGCEYIGVRPLQIATESTLSIQENRELINRVNHPNMRVLVDCYNGTWSEAFNGAEMVRELRDVICSSVHAKDGPDDALIGQGNGDFLATAQELKRIGFDGYIMSENSYRTDAETRAAADLATLKQLFA